MNRLDLPPKDNSIVHTDLLILGAGPAGCAAAITCLQSGNSMTLLELQARDRKIPGETLHPAVELIFKQLGVWDAITNGGFHRHSGIWHKTVAGLKFFTPYGSDKIGDWLGFQVDRVTLNDIMRHRVAELGSSINRVSQFCTLRQSGDGKWHVKTEEVHFVASMIFDATGKRRWLANQLGIHSDSRGPSQTLTFGWNSDQLDELEGNPIHIDRDDGWDWLAPLGRGRDAWVKLRRDDSANGMDATWTIFPECAGPGYFLLGDAAAYMDPSAANGVLRAMMTGIYAAHLWAAISSGAKPEQAFNEYRRWVVALFDSTYNSIFSPPSQRMTLGRTKTPMNSTESSLTLGIPFSSPIESR